LAERARNSLPLGAKSARSRRIRENSPQVSASDISLMDKDLAEPHLRTGIEYAG